MKLFFNINQIIFNKISIYIDMVNYDITDNNIHIQDSYRITKKSDMQNILDEIRNNHDSKVLYNRTDKSMIYEWASHNLCYDLHILRDHTADVDLDYPQPKWLQISWIIVGTIYQIFH